jgi:PPOX class probable F420-dependent enzyme
MPGYGTSEDDAGLLPWSWAAERLVASHDYWVASLRPDGRPHVMPVWAVWLDGALWFSSSGGSRKARNLLADPRCTVTTDDAKHPVVVEGRAERVTDADQLRTALEAENAKYGTSYGEEMIAPENPWFRVTPSWVFALDSDDFTGSPTRFVF